MKRKISGFFCAVLAFFAAEFSSAYTAEEIIGKENLAELLANGSIQLNRFKEKKSPLSIVPETELCRKLAAEWDESEKSPTLSGENLYVLPREKIGVEKASVVVREVSKMQGIEYYSNSEKRNTVLYREAYCVDESDLKTKIPDNTAGSADGVIQYGILDDNSLGKTTYKVSYSQTENEVSMNLVNVTPVYYGVLRAVKSGNLHINLVMTICDDYVIVYMNLKADFLAVDLIEKRMKKSLLARIDAISDWFADGITNGE
jgi:hypothetical protein